MCMSFDGRQSPTYRVYIYLGTFLKWLLGHETHSNQSQTEPLVRKAGLHVKERPYEDLRTSISIKAVGKLSLRWLPRLQATSEDFLQNPP